MTDTMISDYALGKRVLYVGVNPKFGRSICTMIEQGSGHVTFVKTVDQSHAILSGETAVDLILINDGDNGESAIEKAHKLRGVAPVVKIVLFRHIGKRTMDHVITSCIPKPVKRSAIRELFVSEREKAPIYEMSGMRKTPSDRAATHNLSVLIVEDNKMNQKVAIKMLQQLGFSADVVDNGFDAIDMIKETGYDVVFMDMMMPGMDGLDTTRAIRSDREIGRQPLIIALTANATTEDRKMCLEAGMDDYASKPVSSDTLANILDRAKREARTRHGARLDNPTGPNVA